MSWPTTRRYPRTLAEAFPDVRAPAIEVAHLSLRGRVRKEWGWFRFMYRMRRLTHPPSRALYLAVIDYLTPEPF